MTKELLEEIGIESSFYTDMLRATEKYFPRESYNELFLLATQATIRSGSYRHFFSFLSYHELALPALASAIESGEEDEIAQALLPLQKESAGGALFLGCTHFPLVAEEIVRLSGGEVIDPAIFVREVVKKWDKGETGNIVAHLSGETAVFEKFIKQYLPGEEYELCKASFGGNS
jgi:glutamate racemase